MSVVLAEPLCTVCALHNSRGRHSHWSTPKVMQCSDSELAASCLSVKAANRSPEPDPYTQPSFTLSSCGQSFS